MTLSREILLQGETNFNFIYLPRCCEMPGIANGISAKCVMCHVNC